MIEERLSVGLVVERIAPSSPWADSHWRPAAVLPAAPDVAPWTVLRRAVDRESYFAGEAHIHLYSTDTANYRDNLEGGEPKLWVVMRRIEPPSQESPFLDIVAVTCDPAEGEAHTEAGSNIVETIAMPASVAGAVAAFVAAHHVERPTIKRQRDRASPDIGRHRSGAPSPTSRGKAERS